MKLITNSLILVLLSLSHSAFAAEQTTAATKAAGEIVIPKVVFHRATAKDVVAWLNIKSKENDSRKKGVSIALAGSPDSSKSVDLDLTNATVLDILRASAGQVALTIEGSDTMILLSEKSK